MTKWCVVFTITMLITACSRDVRDTKIADIDLTDAASVQRIAQKLEPNERAAFGTYVLNRTVGATVFPGHEIVRADGKAPLTVREAIELTNARKVQNDARNLLMDERNGLVERLNALMPDDGSGLPHDKKAEWDSLEAKIADYDRRIKEADENKARR